MACRSARRGVRPVASIALVATVATAAPSIVSADALESVRAALPDLSATTLRSRKIDLAYRTAREFDGGGAALSRLSVEPQFEFGFGRAWTADLALRAEFADDEVGLGTVDTFHAPSRPVVDGARAHIGLERATLGWRKRRDRVTLGKQTIAWGVLDGLQVTDRYDPVRRRDAVLTELGPERIARWGARWRTEWRGTRFDFALTLDPSVSQLARRGDTFEVTAPRYTGGADPASEVTVGITDRGHWREDATYGLRLSRRWRASEASVLAFSGPDPEPVLRLDRSGAAPAPRRDHPRRALIGATYERSSGAFVLRAEAAHIPDQPLNIVPADPRAGFEVATEARTLVGVGVDWNGPAGLFLNAQLATDRFGGEASRRYRPARESVATLRLSRGFANDRLELEGKWIGSLVDGDGVVRVQADWQHSDNVFFLLGADVLYGEASGTFGQFDDADRIWAKLVLSR